ncbi:MAG: TnpV protein [Clostridiaceae bacterium]|nr:TnpV protein [Clostridiaceae bacterium]
MAEAITYKAEGDYLIPDLTIPQDNRTIGKYGMMRRTYIKQNRPGLYNSLMITGKLTEHLLEIDRMAKEQLEHLITKMTDSEKLPDKATQQMAWVQAMNNLRHLAEEQILSELVHS